MRSKRVRKFRSRYRTLIIGLKGVFAFYLLLFSASYLTSPTSAYFSNQSISDITITAGTWENEEWDGSSLVFLKDSVQNIRVCPAAFSVKITNNGQGNMQGESKYEVYYIKNGNPEHGEKLELSDGDGVIPALKSGEIVNLSFKTSNPGVYVFKAYQRVGHVDGKDSWSKKIIVDCQSGNKSNKDGVVEGTNEEAVIDEEARDQSTEKTYQEDKEIEKTQEPEAEVTQKKSTNEIENKDSVVNEESSNNEHKDIKSGEEGEANEEK